MQFGIYVIIVELGVFRIDFLDGSLFVLGDRGLEDYVEFSKKIKVLLEVNNHK